MNKLCCLLVLFASSVLAVAQPYAIAWFTPDSGAEFRPPIPTLASTFSYCLRCLSRN
jgi:hypothetical protein